MIKDIVLSCLVLFAYLNAVAQTQLRNETFTLKGKIIGQHNGRVFLKYVDKEGKRMIDSSEIQKSKFCFKGNIVEPTLAIFSESIKALPDDDPNVTSFYLESGNMTAIVEKNCFKKIKITGSKTQQEKEIFEKRVGAIANDLDSPNKKISNISYQFIASHPDSYYSAFLLTLYKSRWALDSIRVLYNHLNSVIQTSANGREVDDAIKLMDNSLIGKTAKGFCAVDINGKHIRLSNFKSRYLLLDFWASWCIPCRQGTPQLIRIFEKYHDKGLDILGVSDDDNIEDWKMAINKDKIGIWYNIRSIQHARNGKTEPITQIYGVQTLPTKILIDTSGIIIGRYGGKEDDDDSALITKLNEIFN